MNIIDYSIKVKNLADALASIKTSIDDEDLVAMTLNGLEKYYSQFHTSITIQETFFNFQNLITLLINEKMKIVGTSSNERSQKNPFYFNINRSRGRNGKTSFWGWHKSLHGGHHQHETLKENHGGRRNFKGRGSCGVHGENHWGQQPNSDPKATIAGNVGTWQNIIIKGNMMHKMESCNKGIMHQLVIKVITIVCDATHDKLNDRRCIR